MSATPPLVGVDGCRGGWLAASRLSDGASIDIACFPTFDALLKAYPADALIAVDMPIGLPKRIVGPGRAAEISARRLLRGRQSSVFSIPARAAVESHPLMFIDEAHRRAAHAEASALARTLSDPPKGVSIQGFSLFPRIIELDGILRDRPGLSDRVFESHPEMAFRVMKDGLACELPKKVKNRGHVPGLAERAALLARAGITDAMTRPVPAGAGRDDLLDALAMLVTAGRIARKHALPYPNPPARDRYGLPIAIWA